MAKNREIIFYENHFDDFYDLLSQDLQEKVDEVLFNGFQKKTQKTPKKINLIKQ